MPQLGTCGEILVHPPRTVNTAVLVIFYKRRRISDLRGCVRQLPLS